MEQVNKLKAGVSAGIALLTALWGWAGWLAVLWLAAMALDYASGTANAIMHGEWSSEKARKGLWHKLGEILAVLVGVLLDIAIGVVLPNIPGFPADFSYTVFLVPLICVWYIITEAGSIVENVGKMGGPVPAWLRKAIAWFGKKTDAAGEAIAPDGKEGKEEI